jgi:hypothetical protein
VNHPVGTSGKSLRRRLGAVVLALCLCPLWLGAWEAAGQSAYDGWATFAQPGITFQYPPGWHVSSYSRFSSFSRLITYGSNVALHDPCVRTSYTTTCGEPIERLPHDGVLVTWTANGWPNWTLRSAPGRSLTVNGRRAKLLVIQGRRADCPASTQESLLLVVTRPSAGNWYQMEGCLRGPHLAFLSDEVIAMIRSMHETSR